MVGGLVIRKKNVLIQGQWKDKKVNQTFWSYRRSCLYIITQRKPFLPRHMQTHGRQPTAMPPSTLKLRQQHTYKQQVMGLLTPSHCETRHLSANSLYEEWLMLSTSKNKCHIKDQRKVLTQDRTQSSTGWTVQTLSEQP